MESDQFQKSAPAPDSESDFFDSEYGPFSELLLYVVPFMQFIRVNAAEAFKEKRLLIFQMTSELNFQPLKKPYMTSL